MPPQFKSNKWKYAAHAFKRQPENHPLLTVLREVARAAALLSGRKTFQEGPWRGHLVIVKFTLG